MAIIKMKGISGSYQGAEIPLDGDLVMGSDPAKSQFVIVNDSSVSGVHCKIQTLGNEVYLTDLGSAEGTYVSGGRRLTPQKPEQLYAGDVFRLGNQSAAFQIDGALERATSSVQSHYEPGVDQSSGYFAPGRILELMKKPLDTGKQFAETASIGLSMAFVVIHAVCSGLFALLATNRFYDTIAKSMMDLVKGFAENLVDNVMSLAQNSGTVGSIIGGGIDALFGDQIDTSIEGLADQTVGDVADFLLPSGGAPFGFAFLSSLIISACFVFLLFAAGYLLNAKQIDLKKSLNVAAVRSFWSIPAALLAMLITLINPIIGIVFFFSLQIFGIMMSYSASLELAGKEKRNAFALAYAVIVLILVIVLLLETKCFSGGFLSEGIQDLMQGLS